jgi:glutathione S-transferase
MVQQICRLSPADSGCFRKHHFNPLYLESSMKLYYSPAACSLASHIALHEAGLPFEIEKVDLGSKKTESGEDFTTINPKGYVPAVKLKDGGMLTEGGAILQYIADQKPESGLAPKNGTMERYRLQEWLTFIGTEVHKPMGSFFNKAMPEETKQSTRTLVGKRLDYVEAALNGKQYLMGDAFSVADAYLFTVTNWGNFVGFDLGNRDNLKAYIGRVAARPHVQAALKAEGLVK